MTDLLQLTLRHATCRVNTLFHLFFRHDDTTTQRHDTGHVVDLSICRQIDLSICRFVDLTTCTNTRSRPNTRSIAPCGAVPPSGEVAWLLVPSPDGVPCLPPVARPGPVGRYHTAAQLLSLVGYHEASWSHGYRKGTPTVWTPLRCYSVSAAASTLGYPEWWEQEDVMIDQLKFENHRHGSRGFLSE